MPSDAKTHQPTEPLDLPVDVGPSPAGGGGAPGAAPAAPRATPPASRRRRSQNEVEAPSAPAARLSTPLIINAGARSVPSASIDNPGLERVE